MRSLLASLACTWRRGLTCPLRRITTTTHAHANSSYEVLVVADNDSDGSCEGDDGTFVSYLARFTLSRDSSSGGSYKVSSSSRGAAGPSSPPWLRLITRYSYGGRGGEMSDLLLLPRAVSHSAHTSAHRLFTFDDRTGIVFEIQPQEHDSVQHTLSAWELWHGRQLREASYSSVSLVPRYVLADGSGNHSAGFKCEWSALQDGKLVVGSHGYEVWPSGSPCVVGQGLRNVQWVKRLDLSTGLLEHLDWSALYNSISSSLGVSPPGYVTHEAATWSAVHGRWFFMPRRVSLTRPWDPVMDGQRGAHLIISCEEGGGDVRVVPIQGPTTPERGFSAMRFVPGTQDKHIIATKTIEGPPGDVCETYLTVVDIEGKVLMPETQISDQVKFEGLEIMHSPEQ
mmetsp:Transcript_5223/g.11414  ORF Transcript_5223/g.11414 Transcript_5223/m.11414 type:complete len:397 (+) Transcript_5223:205-1395(+)